MGYLKDSDGKKLDIRKLCKGELKHFNVMQGACSDGVYIYIAFEQKKKKKRKHRIKIVKFQVSPFKMMKISAPLNLGHANDMAYKAGVLYVTHSGKKKVIHRVDAKTLKKLKDIKPKTEKKAFNGIAPYGDGFIVRPMGSSKLLICKNNKFVFSNVLRTTAPYKTSQGMETNGDIVIRSFSWRQSKNKNHLVWYNKKCKILKKMKVPVTGELEAAFYVGRQLWVSVHRKKRVDGKLKFHAYLYRIGG
jgi:hypothetical protein